MDSFLGATAWKDERLSWPSWLTCSGRFTHTVVTRRLQAERRTGSVRRPKTGVPPTTQTTTDTTQLKILRWIRHSQHRRPRNSIPTRISNRTVSYSFLAHRSSVPSRSGPLFNCIFNCVVCVVGCVAQLAERRSLAGELTLSCARPAADG